MIKVLFVCHGNICRSVSAHYIMNYLLQEEHLSEEVFVDSAATSMEEIGNPIYPPMQRALEGHHIPIGNHHARRVNKPEYETFDLIIAMDEENKYNLNRLFDNDPDNKVHYLMEYTDTPDAIIDDPWYTRDFEMAYREIYKGCSGLIEAIKSKKIK